MTETFLDTPISTLQEVAVDESHPIQPKEEELALGEAVSTTSDPPLTKFREQGNVVQFMPAGLEVTVPAPVPALRTERVRDGGTPPFKIQLAPFHVYPPLQEN